MYQEESIYNLVDQEKIKPTKEPIYKSKYPSNLQPTASTFCLKTTSYPKISNLNGDYTLPRGAHTNKGLSSTFGKAFGSYKKDPNYFVKKGHQYINYPIGINKISYSFNIIINIFLKILVLIAEKLRPTSEFKKPAIPKLSDKPIMGLKSDKNYVTSNAVDVILMNPKKKPVKETLYKEKKDYGQVPKYLNRIRNNIEREYASIREMQLRNEQDEAKKKKNLDSVEIENLREGLRIKLEQLKKEYGNITHKTVFDTLVCQRK